MLPHNVSSVLDAYYTSIKLFLKNKPKLPWNVPEPCASHFPLALDDSRQKTWSCSNMAEPCDSPRNTGKDSKRQSISASDFTPERGRKRLTAWSTNAKPDCSETRFAGIHWEISFAPCFPWTVEVCLHWLSPNSPFPIHPVPRKPHESQLHASSFMKYVESQILRVIKSSSSNVITLYSSLDCHWVCKKKIRRSTSHTNLQCISKMAYAGSRWHLKERGWNEPQRGTCTAFGLLSQGLLNTKCCGTHLYTLQGFGAGLAWRHFTEAKYLLV